MDSSKMNHEAVRMIWTIFWIAQSNGTYSKSLWLIQIVYLINWDNVIIIGNDSLSKISILGYANWLILLTQEDWLEDPIDWDINLAQGFFFLFYFNLYPINRGLSFNIFTSRITSSLSLSLNIFVLSITSIYS